SAELASEYRYSQGPSEQPLVILISQSGETADTLGAAREARRRGSKTLAISNVVGSSLTREADETSDTRAGIALGVAATTESRALSKKYGNARDMFYIGRHANYPVALEGALKLKEISYIHAEAYAAGELKHGPLALVTPSTPMVAVAVRDPTYEKMRSNIGE